MIVMNKKSFYSILFLSSLLLNQAYSRNSNSKANIPEQIAPFFNPPPELAGNFGQYRSPLQFYDGTYVKTKQDWQKRRNEILQTWHGIMGVWPPLSMNPKIEYLEKKHRENFTQHKVKLTIFDNGNGFEVPEVLGDLARKNKLGLIGMHERSRLLDGKFTVKSRIGRGTTVTVQV